MEHNKFAGARRRIRRKAITITILFHLFLLGVLFSGTSGVVDFVKEHIEAWIIGAEETPPMPAS